MDTCAGVRKDGSPCRGRALKGSRFCMFHDPDKREQHRAVSAKGGHNKSNIIRAQKLTPEPLRELFADLLQDIQNTRQGKLRTPQAIALSQLVSATIRTWEAGILSQRLTDIESKVDSDDTNAD